MWSTIKWVIVGAVLLTIIYYFGNELKIILLKFTLPELIIAIGTFATAAGAFYFGLFGNYETRLFIKNKEEELDKKAFYFLTDLPDKITGGLDEGTNFNANEETSRQFISDFERNVLPSIAYLSQRKIKKYSQFIKLANELCNYSLMTFSNKIFLQRKKTFYKIKKEAEKLQKKVDSESRLVQMRKIYDFESYLYWESNIFQIRPMNQDHHVPGLVYAKNEEEARQYFSNEFKRRKLIAPDDDFYLNKSLSACHLMRPKEYDYKWRKKRKISFIYASKKIELQLNSPKSFPDIFGNT